MSRLFVVVTLFTMITGGGSELLQLDPTSSRPLLLSLPRSVDTTNIWIRTFLAGPFGGMRSPVRTEAGVWDYAIETVHEGRLATTLEVIVLVPGYQVQTLDLSSVIDSSERNIEVDMHALPPIPFYGRVRLPPDIDVDGLQVRVDYRPHWTCEFFNLVDCLLGTYILGTPALGNDGTFVVSVPDFANDPTSRSFENPGVLQFWILEPNTGNLLYRLVPPDDPIGLKSVEVAGQYPYEIVFQLEVRD